MRVPTPPGLSDLLSRMSERVIKNQSDQAGPRFYSVADVAQIFGTSRMTIYRAVREGQLPAVRVRGRLFVPARALDAMVDAALAEHGASTPLVPEGVAR
jgi:excisionase family DNA binding protein